MTTKLWVTIDPELKEQAQDKAGQRGLSAIIRLLLARWVAEKAILDTAAQT